MLPTKQWKQLTQQKGGGWRDYDLLSLKHKEG